ncbi:hypothetical protein DPEC_G00298240 [Dallia pectoralis]|uniref:Uncharacterized protein n=1 Tax=Dallia pectoralis TaxID=75939 RepID=A0ACC2FG04_DALPE|nr:hypothetical protein DPEC_G00298240 [Dallia pectoralis]
MSKKTRNVELMLIRSPTKQAGRGVCLSADIVDDRQKGNNSAAVQKCNSPVPGSVGVTRRPTCVHPSLPLNALLSACRSIAASLSDHKESLFLLEGSLHPENRPARPPPRPALALRPSCTQRPSHPPPLSLKQTRPDYLSSIRQRENQSDNRVGTEGAEEDEIDFR